jgi:hypothetical protein
MKHLIWVGVAAILWVISKTRNSACFKKQLPGDPTDLIYYACHWITCWAGLQMQEEERRGLLWGVQLLKQFVNDIFNTRFGWRVGMKRLPARRLHSGVWFLSMMCSAFNSPEALTPFFSLLTKNWKSLSRVGFWSGLSFFAGFCLAESLEWLPVSLLCAGCWQLGGCVLTPNPNWPM